MLAPIIYKKIGKSRSIKLLDKNLFALSSKAVRGALVPFL